MVNRVQAKSLIQRKSRKNNQCSCKRPLDFTVRNPIQASPPVPWENRPIRQEIGGDFRVVLIFRKYMQSKYKDQNPEGNRQTKKSLKRGPS
jgi:hypothetical protein